MIKIFEPMTARKPNYYPETEDIIERAWKGFWTPMKYDFASDYNDFKQHFSDVEKQIITRDISAIGQVEIAVKTFWANIGNMLPHPSIIDAGFTLANSEVIHNKAYEKLLERLGWTHIFEENLKHPVVKGRVEYLRKYLKKFSDDEREQFVYSLILFTLFIENVSLFSQFFVVRWFHRHFQIPNLLVDTSTQIEYTRSEESLHANFGIFLINTIRSQYPELFSERLINRIYEETHVAFQTESAVIDWIIGDYDNPGVNGSSLNANVLKAYIQRRIDASLTRIGFNSQFTNSDLRKYDSHADWAFEEELSDADIDFFAMHSTAYVMNDRSYDINTDIM